MGRQKLANLKFSAAYRKWEEASGKEWEKGRDPLRKGP